MKWLYRLLRLFFCPHKFVTLDEHPVNEKGQTTPYNIVYRQECKYCGRHNTYELR